MTLFSVQDGRRTLQFNGELLGESSSRRHGSYRWIEFRLYKTDAGKYVLERVGQSLVYHASDCPLVDRYGLKSTDKDLDRDAQPCEACLPSGMDIFYPEKIRRWAQVSTSPEAVVDTLTQRDTEGAEYLTMVARRLIETSAARDQELYDSYYKSWIE